MAAGAVKTRATSNERRRTEQAANQSDSLSKASTLTVNPAKSASRGQSKRRDFLEALRLFANKEQVDGGKLNKRRSSSVSRSSVSSKSEQKIADQALIAKSVEDNFKILYGLRTDAEKGEASRSMSTTTTTTTTTQRSAFHHGRSRSLFPRRASRPAWPEGVEVQFEEPKASVTMHAEVMLSELEKYSIRPSEKTVRSAKPLANQVLLPSSMSQTAELGSPRRWVMVQGHDQADEPFHHSSRPIGQHLPLPPRRTSARTRLNSDCEQLLNARKQCEPVQIRSRSNLQRRSSDTSLKSMKAPLHSASEMRRNQSAPVAVDQTSATSPAGVNERLSSIASMSTVTSFGCHDASRNSQADTYSSIYSFASTRYDDSQSSFDSVASSFKSTVGDLSMTRNASVPCYNMSAARSSSRTSRRPRTASESECGSIPPVPTIPAKYALSTPMALPRKPFQQGTAFEPRTRTVDEGLSPLKRRSSASSVHSRYSPATMPVTPPQDLMKEVDDVSSICLETPTFGYVASFVTAPIVTPKASHDAAFTTPAYHRPSPESRRPLDEKPRFTRPQFRPMSAGSNATSNGRSGFDTAGLHDSQDDRARLFAYRIPLRSVSPKTVPEEKDELSHIAATETLKQWQKRLEEARRPSGLEHGLGLSHVKLALAERTHTLRRMDPTSGQDSVKPAQVAKAVAMASTQNPTPDRKPLKPTPRRSSMSQNAFAAWQQRGYPLRSSRA